MTARTFATFEADSASEGVWSETGDLIVPPGRDLADAIVDRLRNRGIVATDPAQHEYYGWAFDADHCWCLLQHPGPWLLATENRSPIIRRLIKGAEAMDELRRILGVLDAILDGEERFSDVHWYTRDEYERPENP